MAAVGPSGRRPPLCVYLPYVDEQGTGMQRFGSEMIAALVRNGIDARILIGQVHGKPLWLEKIPHKLIIGRTLGRLLPGPASALLRLLWIQFILPVFSERGTTLLTLADRELAVFPMMRQIAVVHDLTQATSLRVKQGFAHNLRVWLWKQGLRRSDEVIAISGATKADVEKNFAVDPGRIHVVYEGFDPNFFFPEHHAPEPSRAYLLYAGTLAPNKNIPFLLNVYAGLRQAGVDVDLRIVGRYSDELAEELRATVPAAFRDSIDFAGFVTDRELGAQMRGCAAFVFPSLSEGFGLAPVEAMACGAPVISSYATSLREVVGEGGVLLPPTDQDAWILELTRVLTDTSYQRELSQRALRRSRSYSWDRAAQAYRALLEGTGSAEAAELR